MGHSFRSILATLAAAGVVACGLAPATAPRKAPNTDYKLSTFAFLEEGDLVSFIVDARTTRDREKEAYIPFEILVANRGELKSLTVTRESFTLVDAEGNRYPCVGPRDLLEGYEYLDFDRRLGELAGIVVNRFGVYTRYPSLFSPVRDPLAALVGSSIVKDTVSLPVFSYFIDFVYFPKPKTGVLGKRFEMFLEAPELKDPVFVKFVVL